MSVFTEPVADDVFQALRAKGLEIDSPKPGAVAHGQTYEHLEAVSFKDAAVDIAPDGEGFLVQAYWMGDLAGPRGVARVSDRAGAVQLMSEYLADPGKLGRMRKDGSRTLLSSLASYAPQVADPAFDPRVIDEMRGWIADCSWEDIDPEDVDDLPVAELVRGVHANFEGGVNAFLRGMSFDVKRPELAPRDQARPAAAANDAATSIDH